ncbi:elongation factor 4 [candidate division GN15 bacterium]|uniref:Elongation factor 4 n=1 Tax=candidate division GN15 bacterium TaxID=2072418 RepID=A0A855X4J6_9BACT|nr:MAG: elongation factor 4 [candidate division GN15 bacterium]
MHELSKIRNFSIIAHIDHGKSTLADRLLERTKTLSDRQMHAQVLDSMELEQERGITIKAHAIRLDYKARDGNIYRLNLIDTPGHVDFTYEVSRSLAACDGAILVVDAAQGIEAQTLSNLYLALDNNLEILPVVNKIDLPAANPSKVAAELVELLGCKPEDVIKVSAKQGIGVDDVLEAVVRIIPPPQGDPNAALQAMVFDSTFDSYRGARPLVKIFNGSVRKGDKIRFFSHSKQYEVEEVGFLRLEAIPQEVLMAGDVGYLFASVREVADTKIGDTITTVANPAREAVKGFVNVKPMVFSGLYPAVAEDFTQLRESLEKLKLNDSSLSFTPESSTALGFGFRVGFLGLLHMEIITERLSREYGQTIINTVPNVEYVVHKTDSTTQVIDNPAEMPPTGQVEYIEEPFVESQIIVPTEYIGAIMKLATERRGEYKTTEYLSTTRASLTYAFPLSEIIFDFYDKLKSFTRGYASFDYGLPYYRRSDLVKLDILVNDDPVDALSVIIHREKAYHWGMQLGEKLRKLIPRQMFEVVIQAAIGSRIISRATIVPLRKNVTAKCYGGDITRKRKLLERQKEGKRRMKQIGSVEIPQEAFLAALKIER